MAEKLKNETFNLRINKVLLDQVKEIAKKEGTTASSYIVKCIEKEMLEDTLTDMFKTNKTFQTICLTELNKLIENKDQ